MPGINTTVGLIKALAPKPTDEQVTNAVDDWLDDHPEATTTVQDGSITENKFTDELKLKTIKDYVTPQMYYEENDGDDWQPAFQRCIHSGIKRIVVPGGVYKVENTITIDVPGIIIEGVGRENFSANSASVRIEADGTLDSVIEIQSSFVSIMNVYINGEGTTTYGLYNNDAVSDISVENCYIRECTYGIYVKCYKSKFTMCRVAQCTETGFYINHGTALMTSVVMIDCYADYCKTGYDIERMIYSSLITCACDNSTNAYVFGFCSGIMFSGCGCERCTNPFIVRSSAPCRAFTINAFAISNLNTQDAINSMIYCDTLVNSTISSVYISSTNTRDYVLRTVSGSTNITILDKSITPAKVRGINKDNFIFVAYVPYVTPQMYYETTDGDDWQPAFQRCIDTGKKIIVPKGTYLIESPIEIDKQGTVIEGECRGDYIQSTDGIIIKAASAIDEVIKINANHVTVKNISLLGDDKATYGIFTTTNSVLQKIELENCYVRDCTYGYYLQCNKSKISMCYAASCDETGFNIYGYGNSLINSVTLIGCFSDYCKTGYNLEKVTYSSMIDCSCDNSEYAFMFGNCSGIVFDGCGCSACVNPFVVPSSKPCKGFTINAFGIVNLATAGAINSMIYVDTLANSTISGVYVSTTNTRDYILRTVSGSTSITVLDKSVPPNTTRTPSNSPNVFIFSAYQVVYNNSSAPDFEGQIAVVSGVSYIGVKVSNTLQWKTITVT